MKTFPLICGAFFGRSWGRDQLLPINQTVLVEQNIRKVAGSSSGRPPLRGGYEEGIGIGLVIRVRTHTHDNWMVGGQARGHRGWSRELGPVLRSLGQQSGQGLVEYGLIIFLFAIVIMAILILVGPALGINLPETRSGAARDACLKAGYPGLSSNSSGVYYCTNDKEAVPVNSVSGRG